MKNEKLEMKREVWEYFRQYKQAPFQKRYLELLNTKEMNKATNHHN
ncbi:MAG: hypothetical protein ACFFCY_11400 [Promethearchaeota archaeon]